MKNTEDSSKQIPFTQERMEYLNGIVRFMGEFLGSRDITGSEGLHVIGTLLGGVVIEMGIDRKEWNALTELMGEVFFKEK